jgi:aryl-alcohol dehydrogenase-like predicted oxidoreductase/enamine deaminase RidA (YjgF/YER057c/UK114 family)
VNANVAVERCVLAPGLAISRILTGLWQIADLERDGAVDVREAARAMRPYVDAGFSTFDMADHYGSAEVVAGAYAQDASAPGPVERLTKWVPTPGPVTREQVRAAVHRSLDRLQTDRLDLLQFHAWSYPDPVWLDCLFWLDELRLEGRIGHLGLTNFDTAHLRVVLASGIPVVSNQVCFSLVDQRPRRGMTDLCLERGVKLLVYGTVAGGFLTERWLGASEPDWDHLETWSQMKYGRFIRAAGGWAPFQKVLTAARDVAEKHGVSIANVACRAVLENPAVGGVIVGARLGRSDHIADNLQVFSFSLDEEDRSHLREAQEALHPLPGDSGDEYRKPPFLTASGDLSHHVEEFPVPYAASSAPGGGRRVLTGTVWEDIAGFSRAVRRGDRILVSGTTATHGARRIGGDDPAAQLHFIIDKIEGAIQSLGGRLEDVVRTRLFIHHEEDWEAVSRVHGERFGQIQPANTLVRAGLIGEGYRVEMEAEAVVSASREG